MRDCDTVEFFPHAVPFPRVLLNDHLKQAATDIISILLNPLKIIVPSLIAEEDTTIALYEIAKLLKRVDPIPDFNIVKEPTEAPPARVPNTKPQQHVTTPQDESHIIPFETNEIESSLDNEDSDIIPASTLQAPSNLLKMCDLIMLLNTNTIYGLPNQMMILILYPNTYLISKHQLIISIEAMVKERL